VLFIARALEIQWSNEMILQLFHCKAEYRMVDLMLRNYCSANAIVSKLKNTIDTEQVKSRRQGRIRGDLEIGVVKQLLLNSYN
jgi:hypothetical protein